MSKAERAALWGTCGLTLLLAVVIIIMQQRDLILLRVNRSQSLTLEKLDERIHMLESADKGNRNGE